jgi:hypothetical protein
LAKKFLSLLSKRHNYCIKKKVQKELKRQILGMNFKELCEATCIFGSPSLDKNLTLKGQCLEIVGQDEPMEQ